MFNWVINMLLWYFSFFVPLILFISLTFQSWRILNYQRYNTIKNQDDNQDGNQSTKYCDYDDLPFFSTKSTVEMWDIFIICHLWLISEVLCFIYVLGEDDKSFYLIALIDLNRVWQILKNKSRLNLIGVLGMFPRVKGGGGGGDRKGVQKNIERKFVIGNKMMICIHSKFLKVRNFTSFNFCLDLVSRYLTFVFSVDHS